jgi:type II secretory pathway pseudopilin PulG
MTLVEALVGVALLAICGMILFTGFSTAYSLMRKGTDAKITGQQAAAAAEGVAVSDTNIGISQENGTISFEIDGTQIQIDGQYATTFDENNDGVFKQFLPN